MSDTETEGDRGPSALVDHTAVYSFDESIFQNVAASLKAGGTGIGDDLRKVVSQGETEYSSYGDPQDFGALDYPIMHVDKLLKGAMLSRYPVEDTATGPSFPLGVDMFVFPHGAVILGVRPPPCVQAFVLTEVDGTRVYGFAYLHYYQLCPAHLALVRGQMGAALIKESQAKGDTSLEMELPSQVWGPSALVLLTRFAFTRTFTQLLTLFTAGYHASNHALPPTLAKQLHDLANGYRIVHPERPLVSVTPPNCSVGTTELRFPSLAPTQRGPPLADIDFRILFRLLDPDTVIEVLEALLAESSLLVVSDHWDVLCPCLEALLSMLYPFKWPFAYIPVLPTVLREYLEVPQPYLIGAKPDVVSYAPKHTVVLNLDLCTIQRDEVESPSRQLPEIIGLRLRRCAESFASVFSNIPVLARLQSMPTSPGRTRASSRPATLQPPGRRGRIDRELTLSTANALRGSGFFNPKSAAMADTIGRARKFGSLSQFGGASSVSSPPPLLSTHPAVGVLLSDLEDTRPTTTSTPTATTRTLHDAEGSVTEQTNVIADPLPEPLLGKDGRDGMLRSGDGLGGDKCSAGTGAGTTDEETSLLSKQLAATPLALRTGFMDCFVSLLMGYRCFLSGSEPRSHKKGRGRGKGRRNRGSSADLHNVFDCPRFVAESAYDHYVTDLIQTQMFSSFVTRRLLNQKPDWFDSRMLEVLRESRTAALELPQTMDAMVWKKEKSSFLSSSWQYYKFTLKGLDMAWNRCLVKQGFALALAKKERKKKRVVGGTVSLVPSRTVLTIPTPSSKDPTRFGIKVVITKDRLERPSMSSSSSSLSYFSKSSTQTSPETSQTSTHSQTHSQTHSLTHSLTSHNTHHPRHMSMHSQSNQQAYPFFPPSSTRSRDHSVSQSHSQSQSQSLSQQQAHGLVERELTDIDHHPVKRDDKFDTDVDSVLARSSLSRSSLSVTRPPSNSLSLTSHAGLALLQRTQSFMRRTRTNPGPRSSVPQSPLSHSPLSTPQPSTRQALSLTPYSLPAGHALAPTAIAPPRNPGRPSRVFCDVFYFESSFLRRQFIQRVRASTQPNNKVRFQRILLDEGTEAKIKNTEIMAEEGLKALLRRINESINKQVPASSHSNSPRSSATPRGEGALSRSTSNTASSHAGQSPRSSLATPGVVATSVSNSGFAPGSNVDISATETNALASSSTVPPQSSSLGSSSSSLATELATSAIAASSSSPPPSTAALPTISSTSPSTTPPLTVSSWLDDTPTTPADADV